MKMDRAIPVEVARFRTKEGLVYREVCGAIFESRQEGRPAGKRNPERRELLGVSHFWRNDAGMRGEVALARRSPSCARRTREASSR